MEKPASNLSGDSTPDVAEPLSISIVSNQCNDDHDGQISEPHTDEEVVSVPTTPQRQERRFRLKGLLELKTRNKMEEVLEEAMAHSHRCFAAAMNEFSGFAASFGLEGASRCNSAIPQREMDRTPLRSDVDTDFLQLDTGNVQDSLPRSEDKPLVTLLSASCVESTAQQFT